MLAKTIDIAAERRALEMWDRQWTKRGRKPLLMLGKPKSGQDIESREYSGYPTWCVLHAMPGREQKAVEALEGVNVFVYWPHFKKSICRRAGLRDRINCAVMPGLLFAPVEMLELDNRNEIFEWARIGGFVRRGGYPVILRKADIEVIRRIDAKLNTPDRPTDARGIEIAEGRPCRFIDPQNVRLFGDGVVFEVAHERRIGVTVSGLFGGPQKLYVAADEIEML